MENNKKIESLILIFITSLMYGLAVAFQAFKRMKFRPSFSEFSDSMALTGMGKSHEIFAIFSFIIVSTLVSVGLLKYKEWISDKYTYREIKHFNALLMCLNLPFIVWIGTQFFNRGAVTFDIVTYNFLLSTLSIFLTFYWFRFKVNHSELKNPFVIIPMLVLLSMIVPCIISNILLRYDIEFKLKSAIFSFSFLWAIVFILLINKKFYIRYSLLLFQSLAIIGLIKLIPVHYKIDGIEQNHPISLTLYILVSFLILMGLLDLYIRFYKNRKVFSITTSWLSPSVFIAILVLIGINYYIPGINPDDYHFGEVYLPVFLIKNFQSIPYSDYSLAHGFIDTFSALGSMLFFDGNASTFFNGHFIVKIILVSCFFILSSFILKNYFEALFLSVLVLFLTETYIIGAAMSLVLISNLSEKRIAIIFLIMGLFIYLVAPAKGAIFIVALLPLVIMRVVKAKQSKVNLKGILYFSLSFIAICILFPPFFTVIIKSLRYILENSAINLESWGIPWQYSWDSSKSPNSSIFLFELIRFSWALIPVAIAIFLFNYKVANLEPIFYGIFIFIFICLIYSYSMGRIDPFNISRPGQISQAILPLSFILFASSKFRKNINLYIIMLLGLLFGALNPNFTNNFTSGTIMVTSAQSIVDGNKIGIPHLGLGTHNPGHIHGIMSIKGTIDKFLNKEETFLNLSNRGALHYYLNREKAMEAVPYNLAHSQMQKRVVTKLDENPPPILYAEKDLYFTIRTHTLYDWVVQNYYPVEIEGYFYGIHKNYQSRFKERFPADTLEMGTQKAINTWNTLFDNINLHSLPASWGNSKKSLNDKMTLTHKVSLDDISILNQLVRLEENKFELSGTDPYLIIDVDGLNISSSDGDFLMFDFERNDDHVSTQIEVFLETDIYGFEHTHLLFGGHNGTLTVPLDSKPMWTLSREIKKIRIDVVNHENLNSTITIKNVSLMKRK